MSQHRCPRRGCTRTVDGQYLMCGPDWRLVPQPLQAAVYAAYRRGKGVVDGVPTEELAAAQDAAIAHVNGEEA